jgi:hypothetical protein
MKNKYIISIENLHLIAGFSLIISGALVYFISGIEMALSWGVFGAMYISMSDIGEGRMCCAESECAKHKLRRAFGYIGALLGVFLVFYYLLQIL